MKKRWTALVCCLLLIVQMAAYPVKALETVYFTAINANVLPLTEGGMPFWSGGYLYVDSSIFTMAKNTPGRLLGIFRSLNTAKQVMVLSADGRSLIFDLNSQTVQDNRGIVYYPAGVQRNGRVFVPVSLVTYFFDLTYSSTRVNQKGSYHGYLVRIQNDRSPIPNDRAFVDAATYLMQSRYEEYLERRRPQPPPELPQVPTPSEPVTEPAVTPEGKQLRLCIQASDGPRVRSLLDTLDREGIPAVFYGTKSFLETQGDLLRRMNTTGYGIGLLVDGNNGDVTAQLHEANQALERAICGKTRLVQFRNGSAAAAQAAKQAGYCPLRTSVDWSGHPLNGTGTADSLLQRVNRSSGGGAIWLDGTANAAGLREFLRTATQAEHQFQRLTELN